MFQLDELIRKGLAAKNDRPAHGRIRFQGPYFGAQLEARTLLPGPGACLGETLFTDWIARQAK
ncbi:MAG: hypothetical protein ACJ736_06555 [Streptomyces sp.]